MELKSNITTFETGGKDSSNRTFMELKYVRGRRGLASVRRSNRTFMELK